MAAHARLFLSGAGHSDVPISRWHFLEVEMDPDSIGSMCGEGINKQCVRGRSLNRGEECSCGLY